MKLDKKQIPQLIVLGILVLVCIGYVSFTVLKAPPVALKQNQPDNSGGTAVVHLAARPIQSTSAFPDLNTPVARRDPFTVQAVPNSAKDDFEEQKPSVAANKAAMSKVSPMIPPMSTFASSIEVQPSEQRQTPYFVLTGVIRGAENVAIIRTDNSERYVVKQGQFINGRYKVLSVTADGVVLACGSHRIQLKLGGVQNAS